MPAKSEKQRKFMALVRAFKRGEKSGDEVSQAVKDAAAGMTDEEVTDFMKTSKDEKGTKKRPDYSLLTSVEKSNESAEGDYIPLGPEVFERKKPIVEKKQGKKKNIAKAEPLKKESAETIEADVPLDIDREYGDFWRSERYENADDSALKRYNKWRRLKGKHPLDRSAFDRLTLERIKRHPATRRFLAKPTMEQYQQARKQWEESSPTNDNIEKYLLKIVNDPIEREDALIMARQEADEKRQEDEALDLVFAERNRKEREQAAKRLLGKRIGTGAGIGAVGGAGIAALLTKLLANDPKAMDYVKNMGLGAVGGGALGAGGGYLYDKTAAMKLAVLHNIHKEASRSSSDLPLLGRYVDFYRSK